MNIIDGKKLSKNILANIKSEVASLEFQPIFCDVLIGNDPSSVQYVQMKQRRAESVGIHFHTATFGLSITTEELMKEINILNNMPNICGIIIQLPLPISMDQKKVLDAIDPMLDVDCLGTIASTEFYDGKKGLGLPTALACMAIIDSLDLNLKDKKIVVLGQGQLVGKPISTLLTFRGFTSTVVISKTENKEEIIKEADLIISGMGKGRYITGEMIKEGAVLIDAGTSESDSGIIGDIDLDSVKAKASYVSPVPGGVGPVTVAMLLNNVLTVAKQRVLMKTYINNSNNLNEQ